MEDEPFTIKVTNGLVTNESFVGQIPDILRELESIMNFSSYLTRPEDNEWGRIGEDGEWTGIISMAHFNRNRGIEKT